MDKIDRAALDLLLADLEADVPSLMSDRNAFPRAFEDRVEVILSRLDAKDERYALDQFETIVERCRFNA